MGKDSPQKETYSAPYGRTCMNCSQSKCKCIYPKAGGRCQRCQRLNKDCRQPPFQKRQNARKSPSSRTTRLEEKLEDLVSLLRAGVQPSSGNITTALLGQSHISRDVQLKSAVSPPDSLDASFDNSANNAYHPLPNAAVITPDTSTADGSGQTRASSPDSLEPTALQAEEYLTSFHTRMLPYFPCVYIPPDITAEQLRSERPFLWLCIMAVASRIDIQRRALCEKIKNIVAQQMVHDSSNHDIDILLGLLVYLVWSNQQVYNKPNIHVFSQLAIAAVYELGIHDPSANGKHLQLCVATESDEGYSAPPNQTMEERRAVLGCFLITSIIATFLQRTDSLRWTPYMDECLQMLEEHQECPNDEILVQQVRLQLMNEKLVAGGRHGGLTTTLDLLHTPPAFYLRPIETQLQSIKSRIAPHSQGYNTLLLHHYHTISILNESARTKATSTNNSTLQKIECLYACLDATKSWFEIFLSIPPAEYIGFPFSIFSQMVYNLLTLYNLSTLEDPDWDTNNVRQVADVLSILSKVIHNMGQVATLVGLDDKPDSDIFSRVAKMYRSVQMGWEAKLGYDYFLPSAVDPAQQPFPEPLEAMPINFPQVGDNDWLLDMLNSITQSNRV